MKHLIILLTTITIMISGCVNIDKFEKPEQLTQQNLLEDWKIFTGTLYSFHPGLNAYHSKEENNLFLDAQEKRITPTMAYNEFYALICESLDFIGDGHTVAIAPMWYYERPIVGIFPLYLQIIDGELYNMEKDTPIPFGSRITSIEGRTAAEVLDELDIYITSDGIPAANETEILSYAFADIYTDHFGDKTSYKISWIGPENAETKTTEMDAFQFDNENFEYAEVDYEPEPITSYEFRVYDNNQAYLGIHTFEISEEEGYTGSPEEYEIFLRETFKEIKATGADELILDLRQNGGGDPLLMAQLLSYLIDEDFAPDLRMFAKTQMVPMKAYILPSQRDMARDVEDELQDLTEADGFGTYSYINIPEDEVRVIPDKNLLYKGELKVLISAATFSAGSMCAALLEDRTDAITIGQETSGGMSRLCAAADFSYRLPHTGIELSIPTVGIFVNLKNDAYQKGRGVIPDVIVDNRAKLLFDGRDPELEAAMMK